MAVINVVTFKDVWKKKFDGAYVFTDDFWVNNLTVVKTDYMRITETVGYAAFWKFGFRMISKDFKNSRFKFVIALPIKNLI
ncbi:unnamed protein product [Heterobilharzia americana]|nr:unnamed protein product [Heterobilharzia americana]